MKKLLSISAASFALASLAAYTPVYVGVTEITPTSQNTIVPAPYESLVDGGSIAVKDLVKAANLPPGTMLYYYNGSAFNAWEKNDGTWAGCDISTKDGVASTPGSDTVKLAVGSALWVVFTDAPTSGQKIYVYGAPSLTKTSTIPHGTTALVANVLTASVDINSKIANAANGDAITIVGGATYTRKGGKWGTLVKGSGLPTFTEQTISIPAGSGFWYSSGGSSDVVISWE